MNCGDAISYSREVRESNDSGRPTGYCGVYSVVEFIGWRIPAGLPANVIRLVSWEPRVAPSQLAARLSDRFLVWEIAVQSREKVER
jgi:hypothetical protein